MQTFSPFTIVIVYALINATLIGLWALNEYQTQRGARRLLAEKWSLVEIVLGVQIAYLAAIIPALFAYIIAYAAAPQTMRADASFLRAPAIQFALLGIATVFSQLSFAAVTTFFVRVRYRLRWTTIGFAAQISQREVVRGIAVGALLLVVADGAKFGVEWLVRYFRGEQTLRAIQQLDPSYRTIEMLETASRHPGFILGALALTVILAPICEELLFRGLVFNALKRRFGVVTGVLVSGLVFCLAHGSILALPAIWLMGVILAIVYHRTGSLWVSIIAHSTNNLIATAAAAIARH